MNFENRSGRQKVLLPSLSNSQHQQLIGTLLESMTLRDQVLNTQLGSMVYAVNEIGLQLKQQHQQMMVVLRKIVRRQDRQYETEKVARFEQPQTKLDQLNSKIPQECELKQMKHQSESQASQSQYLQAASDIVTDVQSITLEPLKGNSSSIQSKREDDRGQPFSQTVKIQASQQHHIDDRMAVVLFDEEQYVLEFSPFAQTLIAEPSVSVPGLLSAVSKWTTQMYDELCKRTFTAYSSKHLLESDAKVYFTKCMILNFHSLTKFLSHTFPDLWMTHRFEIVQHFQCQSQKTIGFMLARYPQKRKTLFSESVRNAVPSFDRSEEPELDILRNIGYHFYFTCVKEEYPSQVKLFVNQLIEHSQKWFPKFESIMKGVFTVNGKELKHLIGTKLRNNTPRYTQKEVINSEIDIKAPEILRVFIKWIEQLEKKVQGLSDGSLMSQQFNLKQIRTSVYLSKQVKQQLLSNLSDAESKLDSLRSNFSKRIAATVAVVSQFVEKYSPKLKHVPQKDLNGGLVTYAVTELAEKLSVNYLVELIGMLLGGENSVTNGIAYNPDESTIAQNSSYQFVTFNISDLLRCKCSGSLVDVQRVYQAICSHPLLEVYRAKNRLDTGNRDFLLNIKIKDCPLLCEAQLAVIDDKVQPRQLYLDHFNHFLYQLVRAKYGSLAQAVMINSHLSDTVSYFEKQVLKINMRAYRLPSNVQVLCDEDGRIIVIGWKHTRDLATFICFNCKRLIQAHRNSFPNFEQDQQQQQTSKLLCGECVFQSLDNQQQSTFLLGKELSYFMTRIGHINEDSAAKILGVIHKSSRTAQLYFYQLVRRQADDLVYVPVFYNSAQNPQRIDVGTINQDYYIFVVKQELRMLMIPADHIARVYLNRKKGPVTLKDLVDREQLARLEIYDRRLLEQSRELRFCAPTVNISTLWSMNHTELLHVAMCDRIGTLLVLNNSQSEVELKRIVTGCRQLRQVELDRLRKLVKWDLDNSNLGAKSFAPLKENLEELEEVSMEGNSLADLLFISSSSLKSISLSSNLFTNLDLRHTMFPGMVSLNLSSNMVSNIQSLRHSSLNILNLASNRLVTIDCGSVDLPCLEELQLSNNELISLDLSSKKMPALGRLLLDSNKLETIVLPAASGCQLTELVLSNNSLVELDWRRIELALLRKLLISISSQDADDNQLSAIYLPQTLPQLQLLDLKNNKLKMLDLSQTNAQHLKTIEVAQCQLVEICFPTSLPSLEVLRLYTNKLQKLNMANCSLPKLAVIAASKNKIEQLQLNSSMSSLSVLSIHTNRLRKFDLSCVPNSRLESISVNYNFLQEIVFANAAQIERLKVLHATYNCFNLPIPSNIELVRSNKVTGIRELTAGIGSDLIQFVSWLLWQSSKDDIQELWKALPPDVGDSFSMLLGLGSDSREETTELRELSLATLRFFQRAGKVPKVFLAYANESLSASLPQ